MPDWMSSFLWLGSPYLISMLVKIAYLRWILLIEMLSTVVPVTDCCSSRIFQYHSVSKNPSSRKNSSSSEQRSMSESDLKIVDSIVHSKCLPPLDTDFCGHRGRCFTYKVYNYTLPSCECSEGYMGERCELKYLMSSYYPIRTGKVTAAKVCFGAVAVSIFSAFLLYYCQNRCNYLIKTNFDDG